MAERPKKCNLLGKKLLPNMFKNFLHYSKCKRYTKYETSKVLQSHKMQLKSSSILHLSLFHAIASLCMSVLYVCVETLSQFCKRLENPTSSSYSIHITVSCLDSQTPRKLR